MCVRIWRQLFQGHFNSATAFRSGPDSKNTKIQNKTQNNQIVNKKTVEKWPGHIVVSRGALEL